jgi:cytochrome b561
VSPRGIATVYFGLFEWPHIWFLTGWPMDDRREYVSYFVATHNTLAFTAVALIVLHVCAALYHQFIRKDAVLWRMLPGKTPKA